MEEKSGEQPERRKGNISHLVDVFVGKQSRKVAFGVWGFLAANGLIGAGKIDMQVYLKMFFTCASLIGFGTILDSILEKVGDKFAAAVVTRVNVIIPDVPQTPPAV